MLSYVKQTQLSMFSKVSTGLNQFHVTSKQFQELSVNHSKYSFYTEWTCIIELTKICKWSDFPIAVNKQNYETLELPISNTIFSFMLIRPATGNYKNKSLCNLRAEKKVNSHIFACIFSWRQKHSSASGKLTFQRFNRQCKYFDVKKRNVYT